MNSQSRKTIAFNYFLLVRAFPKASCYICIEHDKRDNCSHQENPIEKMHETVEF